MLAWDAYLGFGYDVSESSGDFTYKFRTDDSGGGGETGVDLVWELQPDSPPAAVRNAYYSTASNADRTLDTLLAGSYASLITPISPLDSGLDTTQNFGYSGLEYQPSQTVMTDNSGAIGVSQGNEYLIPKGVRVEGLDIIFAVSRLSIFESFLWQPSDMAGQGTMWPVAKDIGFTWSDAGSAPSDFGDAPRVMVGLGRVDHGVGEAPARGGSWYAFTERDAPDATWIRFGAGKESQAVPYDDGFFNCADGKPYKSWVKPPTPLPLLPDHAMLASCCVHALDFPCPLKFSIGIVTDNYDYTGFPDTTWSVLLCVLVGSSWETIATYSIPKEGGVYDDGSAEYQVYAGFIDSTLAEPDTGTTDAEYHLGLFVFSGSIDDVFFTSGRGLLWCGMSHRDLANGQMLQMPGVEPVASLTRSKSNT